MKKLLTVGFAHYEDFNGAYFTANSARLSVPERYRDRVEILTVDTGHGNSEHSRMLREQFATIGGKFVHFPGGGTSTGRNRVVQEASGEFVLVMDCHVMLPPKTWEMLLETVDLWAKGMDSPHCPGLVTDGLMPHLVQGPILMDNHNTLMTHFFDRWEAEMWGKWGFGLSCECGKTKFTPAVLDGKFLCLDFWSQEDVRQCDACKTHWLGAKSEEELAKTPCRPLATVRTAYDTRIHHWFEVPGQGLGMFLTSKADWLEFHPQAKGFGAEEMCVHELYRQAGLKAIVIPWLLWQHRFGRPDGIPYRVTKDEKMRNYVLWFQRLGRDLEPIRRHFIDELKVDPQIWERLIADPVGYTPKKSCSIQASDPKKNLQDLFNRLSSVERDLNQHMSGLRSMVDGGVVVEITNRQESTVAFAAAIPAELHSFQLEMSKEAQAAYDYLTALGKVVKPIRAASKSIQSIPDCDLLFIDSEHTYERLSDELERFAQYSRRFVAMHDTTAFGLNGEGGGMGLRHAIADFLYRHGGWGIAVHTDAQHGLTVLARRPEDRIVDLPLRLPGRGYGPGSHLKEVLKSLGINPSAGCECNATAGHMDALGVAGCRMAKPQIVAQISRNAAKWGWGSFASAAAKALSTGLVFQINPLDPYSSLVDIAISRAEKEVSEGMLFDPIWK